MPINTTHEVFYLNIFKNITLWVLTYNYLLGIISTYKAITQSDELAKLHRHIGGLEKAITQSDELAELNNSRHKQSS